jgi:uncharacterized protein YbaR (Trm112 family)
MPIIKCPKCKKRYDPGVDEELEDMHGSMSLKVVCPACGQWVRLPELEPIRAPAAPPEILREMRAQSRLVDDDEGTDRPIKEKKQPAVIRLICPGCEKRLQVKETQAGKIITCPTCETRFQVPQPEPDEPPPPKPSRRVTAAAMDEEKPRRGRRDEEEDEEKPRRKRQNEEEEDEDKPRRSRRDEEDEEEEEPRPRPRAKKKKKKSRSRQSGGFAEWGMITKVLVVSAAIWAISFALGFVWPPLMFVALAVGAILSFVGGIMFLIVVIQDDIIQVILCLFVPFYSLFYLVTHFDECKNAFFIQMAGIVFLMVTMCAGVGSLAVMGNPEQPKKGELHRPALVVPSFTRA